MAAKTTTEDRYIALPDGRFDHVVHEPSIRVVQAIAKALDISTETLLAQVGLVGDDDEEGRIHGATEAAISADPYLSDGQREALLAVYRSYVAESRHTIKRGPKTAAPKPKATPGPETPAGGEPAS